MLKDIVFPALVSVITFLICDVILKRRLIEPWARYQILKERAAYCLSFYEPYYTNPQKIKDGTAVTGRDKHYRQAQEELRDCAAQLCGFCEVYPRFAVGIPAKGNIANASQKLFYLSSITVEDIWEPLEEKYGDNPSKEISDAMSEVKRSLGIRDNEVKS